MKRFNIFQGGKVIIGDLVGRNMTVKGRKIVVDGKTVADEIDGIIEVKITGGDGNLSIDAMGDVTVDGPVTGNVEAGMSVNCGSVTGDVEAQMNVTCDDVGGDAKAGMNVTAKDINGNARAGMSINARSVAGKKDSAF